MIKKQYSNQARLRRHQRVRKKVSGTTQRPRLAVFRSATHIYAQVIDDTRSHTLVAASSRDPQFAAEAKKAEPLAENDETAQAIKGLTSNKRVVQAWQVGQVIAQRAKALGITSVIVTHDVYESLKIVDYLYFVSEGRIISQGTPEEVRNSTDPFVRQFVDGQPDGPVPFHYPARPYAEELAVRAR